jgi:1,4-dihydroxy-2-naphthoate polyprenyltransferase
MNENLAEPATVAGAKSVITCDTEGRIETFNEGAEQIFGYSAEEVIGKKRVSLFSPGLVVLAHVPSWLDTAVKQGRFESRTVFLRKDGTPFAADVRITPTRRGGEHIGYCGVTVPRPDLDPAEAMPRIGLWPRIFKWLVVTRAPFLSATLVPVLVAAAWVAASGLSPFPWGLFGLALLGACALHVAANVFNDYFDWKSGADVENNEYFLPFSGGSRSLELGLISERGLLRLGVAALVVAAGCGLVILMARGPGLLWFGLAGAFSAYFYTAPPLRLVARKGLGELLVGLNFGPLMTGGTAYALTGSVGWADFAVGLPLGLLTTAILWINEFPDAPSDARTGKNHLVVVLGKRAARWGYLALVFGAFALITAGVLAGPFPWQGLLALGALPLALYAAVILMRHWADRRLVKANAATIQLHAVAGVLLAIGLFLARSAAG